MTTARYGFENFVRTFTRDPMFMPFRLRRAQARIKALEARNVELEQIVSGLLDRLSEARREAVKA